jgi:hypothetical protein
MIKDKNQNNELLEITVSHQFNEKVKTIQFINIKF